jgi:outer membrane protein with beta-barrel domain
MTRLALLCGVLLLFTGVASAQDSPKVEAFGGYSFVRGNYAGLTYNFNGGSGSLAYNLTPWLGVVGDFGGYHWSGAGSTAGDDATVVSYLFGPKLAMRRGPITPFVQALFGGAHISGTPNVSQNGFAMTIGGGLDWNATAHIGIRVVQAEYLMTRFKGFGTNLGNNENNARISTGVVFRW